MTVEATPLPPVEEVHALWRRCRDVREDDAVALWAEDSGLDPTTLDRYGLVRAIPFRMDLPSWARGRGERFEAEPWNELGFRVLFPLVDEAGEMRSVRACPLVPLAETPPSALPVGFRSTGLAFANPLAVMMLQVSAWRFGGAHTAREHRGDGWPEWADRRLLVVQGEHAFLTWSSHPRARAFAVLGMGPGMWSAAISAAIPDRTEVMLRTAPNDAGDRYATAIARSLGDRCAVRESDPAARAERRHALAGAAEQPATPTVEGRITA